ncbi:MAG: PEGA domain-containing protein [Thermoanaerobaculia bacterium]|nr:PEGA domain-containing protein [Thermoanaerobaculia bacterium]
MAAPQTPVPPASSLPPAAGVPSGRVFSAGGVPVQAAQPGELAPEPNSVQLAPEPVESPSAPPSPVRTPPESEAWREGRVETAPSNGLLRIKITPPDATAYLDDRFLGSGEGLTENQAPIPVGPGLRTLTVVRPGFRTKTLQVDVRSDEPTEVTVTLEK